jgi:pimeloyl-ACP methyl ester carboxylesterase
MGARAQVNGAGLYFEVRGDGPPVVLIHDRASTHEVWASVFGDLADDHHVVAFDSRGVGRSGPLPVDRECTVELLADDVVALLDLLEVRQATLVGISMGGGVAQMCALRHPDRVGALVLVSTSPSFSEATRARMREEADRVEREGIDRDLSATMTSRWFSRDFAKRRPDAVERVRRGVECMAPEVLAARSRANADRHFTPRLGEITCPVLFVAGAMDPMGPTAHAATYSAALPDLEVHMIDDCSHLVPVEAPQQLAAAIRDFVKRRV